MFRAEKGAVMTVGAETQRPDAIQHRASDDQGDRREVGHRVAVTGPLTDREMRAQSVQRVASSCKAN